MMPATKPRNSDLPSAAPTKAQVLELSELDNASPPHTARAISVVQGESDQQSSKLANPLHQVKAKLTVCVGNAELTVGELLDAREQQVLRLDRTVEQPVDILLEGQVIARGTLVAVDDHFGVRITELPLPLKA